MLIWVPGDASGVPGAGEIVSGPSRGATFIASAMAGAAANAVPAANAASTLSETLPDGTRQLIAAL